jgi:UDP-glucose 4-epimerase
VKVLVTGGSGFIGSHVVDRMRAHGHETRIFDLVPSPYLALDEVDTHLGDLLDIDALRAAMRGYDAVVHLAAVADVAHVLEDPRRAELVNVCGTHVLLQAARAEGVARVLYASTVWVYGQPANGNGHGPHAGNGAHPPEPLDEDAPLPLPRHFYTATKAAGEMYCRAYDELYGVAHTILRFGIPYGPRARPSTVLATFVERALAGEPLTIAGDGTQSRRFVYVEDLAEGVVAALAPAASGRIYNLVGSESVSVSAIADVVRELVADVPVVYGPGRIGDATSVEISGARARRELGWQPVISFPDGVRRYVGWLASANEVPSCATASITAGSAATVLRQEPAEL